MNSTEIVDFYLTAS